MTSLENYTRHKQATKNYLRGRHTAFKQWLEVKSSVAGPTTVFYYRRMMKTFWKHVGSRPLADIDLQLVSGWLKGMREEGLSPNTMIKKLEILKMFFHWCRIMGLMAHDPMLGLPKVHKAQIHKVPFTWEQHQLVLQAVAGFVDKWGNPPYWTHACTVAWHTGLRMSDVALLEWDQLDFISDVIHATPKKLAYLRQRIVIPIEPELRVHLLSLDMDNGTPYVHPVFQKMYWYRQVELCIDFRKILDGIGLTQFSYHSYRHSMITRLLNAGASVEVVRQIVGQSAAILHHYAHISVDAKREAMENSRQYEERKREQKEQAA